MLIRIEYNEDCQISPIEFSNDDEIFCTRVEHNFAYISADWKERMTADDGSLILKFETHWNQIASQEARTTLYNIYRYLTINHEQIKNLSIYHDDTKIFDSEEMNLVVGMPFITDTALNIETSRDNYMSVQVPLSWKI